MGIKMDMPTEKKNESDKLDLRSLDPAVARREDLARLFPEARTEGGERLRPRREIREFHRVTSSHQA